MKSIHYWRSHLTTHGKERAIGSVELQEYTSYSTAKRRTCILGTGLEIGKITMHRFGILAAGLTAMAYVSSTLCATAANVSFIPFDDPRTAITGISADGLTVVGYRSVDFPKKNAAFRWRQEHGRRDLVVPYLSTAAYSVSGDGKTIGGTARDTAGFERTFLWTEEAGFSLLDEDVPFRGITGLSFDGTSAIGNESFLTSNRSAYRWSATAGVENLGDLPGGNVDSQARDISGDGTIVVGASSIDTGVAPFRWTAEEGMVQLPTLLPSRPFGRAYAISTDGSTIVGSSLSDRGGEAVVWKDNQVEILGVLPEEGRPAALDVSYGGEVVVGNQSRQLQGDSTAFRWTRKSGMRSLASLLVNGGVDMTGWQLLQANYVSSDGTVIAGYAVDPSGSHREYIATVPVDFVPEPNAGLLVVSAFSCVASYFRQLAPKELRRG